MEEGDDLIFANVIYGPKDEDWTVCLNRSLSSYFIPEFTS